MSVSHTAVAVVGASTAGLVTALGLARQGVEVSVLDTTPPPRLSWSAVHHWSVLPLLEQLGVLDEALVDGEATARWGLHVLATGEQLVYDVRELGPDVRLPFNLRLEPAALRAILRAALRASPCAELVEDVRVVGLSQDDSGAELTVHRAGDERRLRAHWVVGADGATSVVRRLAGLAFEGTTWTERGLVALVRHDFAPLGYPDTTFQVDGSLGAVVERVGHGRWRYLLQESLSQDVDRLDERLGQVLRAVTGSDPEVLDVATSRMHQRSATSYCSGRVLLVGDAAHVTHPMSGHTSLTGWFDAITLAPALTSELRPGGPAARAEDGLTRWAQQRRRHFLDDAAPASLSRRNLVAQIRDPRRLEVELAAFRRAATDPSYRRHVLLGEGGAPSGGMPSALLF